MSDVLTFLLCSTNDRLDNWVEKKRKKKNTGVEVILLHGDVYSVL